MPRKKKHEYEVFIGDKVARFKTLIEVVQYLVGKDFFLVMEDNKDISDLVGWLKNL